jgi:hypothetical protein
MQLPRWLVSPSALHRLVATVRPAVPTLLALLRSLRPETALTALAFALIAAAAWEVAGRPAALLILGLLILRDLGTPDEPHSPKK